MYNLYRVLTQNNHASMSGKATARLGWSSRSLPFNVITILQAKLFYSTINERYTHCNTIVASLWSIYLDINRVHSTVKRFCPADITTSAFSWRLFVFSPKFRRTKKIKCWYKDCKSYLVIGRQCVYCYNYAFRTWLNYSY